MLRLDWVRGVGGKVWQAFEWEEWERREKEEEEMLEAQRDRNFEGTTWDIGRKTWCETTEASA